VTAAVCREREKHLSRRTQQPFQREKERGNRETKRKKRREREEHLNSLE